MNVVCIEVMIGKGMSEVHCIMSMEVTSHSPKICSESIFFPRIAQPMGEPKRMDDSGFTP